MLRRADGSFTVFSSCTNMISVNFALFTNAPLGFPLFSHALCIFGSEKLRLQETGLVFHISLSILKVSIISFSKTFQICYSPLSKINSFQQGVENVTTDQLALSLYCRCLVPVFTFISEFHFVQTLDLPQQTSVKTDVRFGGLDQHQVTPPIYSRSFHSPHFVGRNIGLLFYIN